LSESSIALAMGFVKVKYSLQSINVQSGIFCLMKDRFQDIIWVGADGQGLYMYFTDEFSILE
ncbi:hypothetical protein, partial [Serratia marcescens]|uniref:hypothetical protein n=1 Tax=Serratia marcescens TaxID=615 RepID=UPI0019539AA6